MAITDWYTSPEALEFKAAVAIGGATGGAAGAAYGTQIYGTVKGIQAQRKANEAQKKAIAEEKKRAGIEAARARVQAVREARIKRARVAAEAQSRGITGGTAEVGAMSGIQSQVASNLSFMDQVQQFTQNIFKQRSKAVDYESKAATYGAVSKVAGNIFQMYGGYENFFTQKESTTATAPTQVPTIPIP